MGDIGGRTGCLSEPGRPVDGLESAPRDTGLSPMPGRGALGPADFASSPVVSSIGSTVSPGCGIPLSRSCVLPNSSESTGEIRSARLDSVDSDLNSLESGVSSGHSRVVPAGAEWNLRGTPSSSPSSVSAVGGVVLDLQ